MHPRDWRDTLSRRGCLACATSHRKLATVCGAGRYPGPVLSQARGTSPNTTSQPVLWDAFYHVTQAGNRAGLFSWVVVLRASMRVLSQSCFFESLGVRKSLNT